MNRAQSKARRSLRVAVPLTVNFSKRLAATAATAGTAGMLALAQTASADIIYTPANVTLTTGTTFSLDLNHDGNTDFTLADFMRSKTFSVSYRRVLDLGGPANAAAVIASPHNAGALNSGALIGPGASFGTVHNQPALLASILYVIFSRTSSFGNWNNVTNRYLGLRFDIDGQPHYGWARLDVTTRFYPYYDVTGTLTGYAYDTVAGQQVLAGQTSSTPEPGTLGLLALGSLGLGLWRRSCCRRL